MIESESEFSLQRRGGIGEFWKRQWTWQFGEQGRFWGHWQVQPPGGHHRHRHHHRYHHHGDQDDDSNESGDELLASWCWDLKTCFGQVNP